ncbi:MAG: AAA family ATPase, partial [Flavobacteriaceae bacterium]|nr:AAA family ATPase [Flavobacteriaceae bacterium]
YGNNGSGKSSYSRILKKLCWSRNPGVELKKNVFTPSQTTQQVEFQIEDNGNSINFQWIENTPPNPILSSIYVFDIDCGDIYINRENPTEYKPIGIDVLERLVPLLTTISQNLEAEISVYNTEKPTLNPTLSQTIIGQCYSSIQSLNRASIESYIQFSENDLARKTELFNLINTQNPELILQNLRDFKFRLNGYFQVLSSIESLFSTDKLQEIISLRTNYLRVKQAYDIATNQIGNLNTVDGFGTNAWRTLWESAKSFAHSNGMSNGVDFPSSESLEKCVLCQQNLDENAKQRFITFNQFVQNDISSQLNIVQSEIQQKIDIYNSIVLQSYENYTELTQHITDFQNIYIGFSQSITISKQNVISYLQNGVELNLVPAIISNFISNLFPNVEHQIEQNTQLVENKSTLLSELNELTAKEFLFNNKTTIIQYHSELNYINWISRCQSHLNTSIVSRKIGELMENQAVSLQHQEFVNHLEGFNPELAAKVALTKTRTSQGNTFQKCSLYGLTDSINSILSEGEQKIIALSNFLAECTIDNRKNTIILDDPVTSLDMDYRELIADKIVELSIDRQIIVLTHDLSFLRLLIDKHKINRTTECHIIGIDKYDGISGIVTDEIPYLAKNVQERINSIRRILAEHDALQITDSHGREVKLDSARKRFRMLLERSVEEILSNKTYERFSKNINLKKGNLSGYIVTEQSDVDLLLSLFSKYSVTEHDGGTTTIPLLPSKSVMETDLSIYSTWKDEFKTKLKAFIDTY